MLSSISLLIFLICLKAIFITIWARFFRVPNGRKPINLGHMSTNFDMELEQNKKKLKQWRESYLNIHFKLTKDLKIYNCKKVFPISEYPKEEKIFIRNKKELNEKIKRIKADKLQKF